MKLITPLKSITCLLAILAGGFTTPAADAFLKSGDASGTTSFTGSTNWTIVGAPNAANNYYTSNNFLRTPPDALAYTFGGASLTLQPYSVAATRSILFKGGAGAVLTINNFTNAGGLINCGSGNVSWTIAGNMFTIVSNSTITADQGPIVVNSPLAGGANWTNNGAFPVTYNGTNTAFSGRFIVGGTATLLFNSVSNAPGNPAAFTPGQITLGASTTLQDNKGNVFNNPNAGFTLAGSATINAATLGSNTIVAEPIIGAFTLTKTGAGTLTLAGSNSLTAVTLNGATVGSRLNINSTNALGTGTFTIQSGDNATIDNTSGSALKLLANNAQTWQNNFAFAGSNPLNLGNGAVSMSGTRTLSVNASTLTVGGIISGAGFSVIKVGGGTLALGGANTFSGALNINGGSVVLNSGASIASSTGVTLAGTTFDVSATSFTLGAAQTLSGSGTVNGSVADSSGSQILPGGSGTVGTLTLNNNLTLAGGDTLKFDLATGTNDLLAVSGNLTPSGVTTINLSSLPTVLPSGLYTLIQVNGSLGGSAANFTLTGTPTPSRQTFNIVYATSPNRVQLQVINDSAALVWRGSPTLNWDVVTTANWSNTVTASADIFYNGDGVSFTDAGVANQPVLNTAVQPGSVTFNSTSDYLLSGTGTINGAGGLTKAGSSTLTITTTNNYTGVTAINGGTVAVNIFTNGGVPSPLGAASSASANLAFNGGKLQYTGDNTWSTRGATLNAGGGTLEITNPATTVTLSGVIVGTTGGALTKTGNGTLALSGASTYNGATVVNSGVLITSNGISDVSAVVLADVAGVSLNLGANDTVGSIAGGGVNGGGINLAANRLTTGNNNSSTTYAGSIIGTGGITKTGTGQLTLTGSSSFTGSIFAKAGELVLDSGAGLSTSVFASIGQDGTDNAILTMKGSSSLSVNADFNVGDIVSSVGTLNIQDSATLSVNSFFVASANAAGSTAVGTVNQTGGSVTVNTTTTGNFLLGGRNSALGVGTYNLSGGSLTSTTVGLRLGSAGTGIFNQSGSSTFAANGGVNIARLAGSTGTYNLNGGTLQTLNVTSSQGTNAVFNLNGGILLPTATANNTTFVSGLSRANVRNGGATIDNQGYNLTITQPLLHSDIGGDNAVDGGLTFVSSGTVTLTATNTYTGPTVVNNGVLVINGSLGTGALTINSGVLSGTGIINGATTNVSSTITPAGAAIGTLTINNKLALQGGTVQFNLTKTSNDVVAVSGALSIEAPTTILVNFPAPGLGSYTLMTYGSFTTDFNNLSVTLASPNPRYNFTLTNDTTAKAIKLVLTGNSGSLVWRGDGGYNGWDNAGGYQNWTNSAQATMDYFYDGDAVTFDNTGSNTAPINISPAVAPGVVVVASTNDYDFAGSAINGTANLIKSSTGKLTLENDTTFVNVGINDGAVQVGNGATTGSLNATSITNNGTLILNRSDAVNVTATVSGSGGIQQISTGTAVLSGSNSYAGLTLVTSGILYPHNPAALGSAAGNTVATNGGKLYFDQNIDIANENFVLGGSAIQKGGAGVTTLGGTISLVADTTFVMDGGATLNLTNSTGLVGSGTSVTFDGGGNAALSGPLALGAGALTKSGAGTLTVGANNTFTGFATINAGTLNVVDSTLGNPAVFTANQITLNGGALGANTNVIFADGKSGLTVAADSFINVGAGATLLFSNEITGSAALGKSGAGTLVLGASNSLTGTFKLDAAGFANDGAVRVTSSNALASVASPISSANNNAGSSTLQLDGAAGSFGIAQSFTVNCRNSGVAWAQNLAGNNTLYGDVNVEVGGSALLFQSDAGQLEVAGQISYIGTLTGARTYTFTGAGNHLVSGVINNSGNGAPIGLAMSGTGKLTLAAANNYGNTTVVNSGLLLVSGSITSTGGVSVVGGTLGGTGTINDLVTVGALGTLSPGASIGTLTLTSNLTLSGTTYIEVNKSASTSDQVEGLNNVKYGGTLFATNLAGTLTTNDTFTIFSATSRTGTFTNILGSPGAGLAWKFNPTNGVLGVVTGIASNPTNIVATINGSVLTLSWPVDHLGWILQSQTNNLSAGLATNWVDVAGSATSNTNVINVNATNPAVFFRLRKP